MAPGLRKRRWDRHAMVFTRFGSGRQMLQASKASFLAGSESDVRHWHRGLGSAVGPGMPWCFPVSEAAAKQSAAGSESDVRQWHRGFGSAIGTGMPWCFPLSEAAAKAVSCRLQRLVF